MANPRAVVTYCAFLRGINVNGCRVIKMADLRSSLDASSLDANGGVRTWLQTGNVIFQAASPSMAATKNAVETLEAKIQGMIQKDFGFKVPVMVRTLSELQETVARNPLASKDSKRLFFAFLQQLPNRDLLDEMAKFDYAPEEYAVVGGDETNDSNDPSSCICFYVPNFARYKLDTTLFEKKLQVVATSRNWKTVNKLVDLMVAKELDGAATSSSGPHNSSNKTITKKPAPTTKIRTKDRAASIAAAPPTKPTRNLRKRKR